MSLDDLRRRLRERRQLGGTTPTAKSTREASLAAGAGVAADGAVPKGPAEDFAEVIRAAREERRLVPSPPTGDHEARMAALATSHPAIHERFKALDPWQLAAVLDDASSLLVRAQVGSGKTTVLVARILALLELDRVPPQGLVVMTFTNKAAAEIRARVALALPGREADLAKLRIGTFHGICRGLLRRFLDEEESGRSRRFALLDERSRFDLLREIVTRDGLRIAYLAKLEKRLELLRRGETRFGNMKRDDDLAALAVAFELEKRRRDLMDFDDLIDFGRRCAQTLESSDRPEWIVVDEFQDTDPDQLALLEDWRGATTRLFAVGDPDQVIYSWRGGSIQLFDEFARRFEGRELSLPRNYRSTETILDAARFVLGPLAASHRLVAAREEGAAIAIMRHHDPVAEARHLADSISAFNGQKSVGILVRTREQMEPIREQLEASGLTVTMRERRGADDPLRDWLLAWLDWVDAGAQARGAARVLGDRHFGFNGLKGRKLAAIEGPELAASLAVWLPEQEADRRFLIDLAWSLADFRAQSFDSSQEFLLRTRIEHFLEPRSSRFEGRRRRLLGLLAARHAQPKGDWIEALRDVIALGESRAEGEVERGVELMTMHAAKGLEFDCVFISGANRGMIPLASSWSDPEAEAEERRLFFVAMTRARDDLEIGWFGRPPRAQASPEPSPWLDLIPRRLLHEIEPAALAAPVAPEHPAETPGPAEGGSCGEAAKPCWGAGVTVRHARYGEGVVIEVRDGQVRCVFGARGERSFSLLMCPLVIVD